MAEQTIDKLQVEVTATAKGTNAVFSQLEGQMRTLKRVLDAIDVSKLTTLNKATASVKPKIDTSGLTKAETDAKNSVSKIQQALAGLVAYADKAKLGDSSMMTSFERKATSVQSAIDALDAKFKQMGEIKLPTEAFSKVQAEMEKTESHLESLKRQQQEMKDSGYNPAVSQSDKWDDLVAKLKLAEEEFIRLKAIQDGLVNSGNTFTYPLDAYKEALGSTRAQLEQLVSAIRAAFDATQQKPDNSGLDDTKNKAEEATAALRKMFQQATSKLSDKLKSSLKKIASSLLSIKDAASKAADKGFMKLLKYGFGIRSIYVLFRRLRKAVVESFGELQKSGAFYETTKANVDALKTSLLTLKFQFGAAFEPIFNAVAPAIKVFIDNLVTAMNAISAFMARLTGNSTYSKVKWVNTATEQAAKNAKELNKQLQKFDELNNLTTNQGGSGSGSKNETKAVYEEASVDSALGEFGKKLADLMRAGEWNEVGKTISDKLSEQLESIDWESIKGKAGKFGHNIAEFLNGLIDPRLFGDIGRTIGEAINTGLTFFNEWGKGMNWENVGSSLATGFNEWLKAGNLPLLGETLHTWIAGGLDALNKFLEEADFEELGKQLAKFIGNLNIPDLARKLLTLAKNILKALAEAIGTAFKEGDISTKIILAIGVGLGALSFVGKLAGLAKKIGVALGLINASQWGLDGAANTIAGGLGSQLATKTISIKSVLKVALLAGVAFTLSKVIWKMANGEFDSIQDLIDSLPGSKVEAIKKDIDIQAKLDKAGKSVEDLRKVFGGLKKEIEDTDSKQGDFFDNTTKQSASAGKTLEKSYSLSLDGVGNKFQSTYAKTNQTWSQIGTDGKNFSDKFANAFNTMPGLVSNQFASGYAQSTMKWSGLQAWANKTFGSVPTTAQSKLSQISGHFSNSFATATNQAQSKVSLFQSWFNRLNFEKTAKMKTDEASFNTARRNYENLVNRLQNKTVTIDVKANGISAIGSQIQSLSNQLNSLRYASTYQNLGTNYGVRKFATGGIVSGATRAIVGEAGPEAIIPLTDGTLGSLSKLIVGEMVKPQVAQMTASTFSGFSGSADSSVAEQNALLREEVQLLRQIAGKELTISSGEVFRATQEESNNYYNRTGNSPFLF